MSKEPNTESWNWPEQTWRTAVEHIRAGADLTPKTWPNSSRVAVAVSFDSDHETIPLRDGEILPGKLSQGEFGARVAVPRILRLLSEFDIPATFFMPAVSALLHPGEVDLYTAGGHEVAVHGWIHERNTLLPREVELDLTQRAMDVVEKLSGARPVGIRTPSWDFSVHTLEIIRNLGFTYDSSLMASDSPYELLTNGTPTGIVELPVEWIRDDAPYFTMDRFGSVRPHAMPRKVLEVWRDEFDAAYAEGGFFQLTLHPHVIGHRSRMVVLRDLLDYMKGHSGVWFARHDEVAKLCQDRITRMKIS